MGYSEKEIEINIISLIFYLAKHWRSILIVSLAFVLLFIPIGFRKIQNTKKEQIAAEAAEASDQELNTAETDNAQISDPEATFLTPIDINSVNNCYSSINNYHDLNNYYANAPYMLIDVNATPHSTAIIDISADQNSDIVSITSIYGKLIEDISFHEYASDYISGSVYSWDYLVAFDSEVDENSNRSIVKVSVYYPNEETCSKLLDSAIDFINSDKDSISELYGDYKITVISKTTEIIYSKTMEDIQNNSIGLLDQTYTGIVVQIQEFNKLQLEYLAELIKSNSVEDKELATLISDTIQIKELQNEASGEQESETLTQDSSGEEVSAQEVTPAGMPKSAKIKMMIKYIIIGLFLGFVMSCFFHMMIYILSNRLDYADNLTELFGISNYGNIVRNNTSKCPIDKIIYKLKHLNKKQDENAELDICATDIFHSIEKEDTQHLAIISCKSEFEDCDLLDKLSAKLSGLGSNMEIIQSVLCHSDSFSNLTNIDRVIIAGMCERTLRNDMHRLIDILKRHNITIIGGIIIE